MSYFIWLAIAAFLWHMGKKSISGARPRGEIFCGYLILTGVARFLIEFIRINPRSFFGLSNAQAASLAVDHRRRHPALEYQKPFAAPERKEIASLACC